MNRYHIQAVVNNLGLSTWKFQHSIPITFCPIHLPQSLRQLIGISAKKDYSQVPGMWDRLLRRKSATDYGVLFKVKVQYCPVLVCGQPIPLNIILEREKFIGTVYIRSIKIRLLTTIFASGAGVAAVEKYMFYLLSDLNLDSTLAPKQSQWSIRPQLLCPVSILPTFEIRDVRRTCSLVVKIGFGLTESRKRKTIEFKQDIQVLKVCGH